LRDIIAARDERARIAHDVSAFAEREHLPEPVGSLVDRRTKVTERRRSDYLNWRAQTRTQASDIEQWREHGVSRTPSPDYGRSAEAIQTATLPATCPLTRSAGSS
jgi:hypothetical protein